MAACAGQNKVVAVDLIERQPIRLDVAVAVSAPFTCQRMIIQIRREGRAMNEQTQHVAQLRHVLAAPLGTAGVANELSGMDRRPH